MARLNHAGHGHVGRGEVLGEDLPQGGADRFCHPLVGGCTFPWRDHLNGHIGRPPSQLGKGSCGRQARDNNALRGERTFVGGKQWSQLVLDNGSLAQYIKARQRNVGTLKAGWRPAADALGITGLPKYVKNAPHANGSFSPDLEGDNPSVTLINSARTINRQLNSVLGRALEGRRIRMAADLKNKLAAALAKP